MLTRRSSPLNTVLQQNKRMIYAFDHGRSLSPNQIFRRLILINGVFNVIFLLNIHCNVVAPPRLLYSGSSKCKILRFCLSFVPPRSPFLFFLPVWSDTSVTERAASSERRKEEISFLFLADFTLRLLSDTFDLDKDNTETCSEDVRQKPRYRLPGSWCFINAAF